MPNNQGVRVDFSKSEIFKFEKDVKLFVNEFGERDLERKLRSAVRRFPLKEARAILAQEAQTGSGSLEDRGLIIVKEKGSNVSASLLLGGGRAKKYIHGFIAHWVELGTTGVVRDGGQRYRSGTRYRAPQPGIHFLERSAENTRDQVFNSLQKSFNKAFRKLGK
jgi:hypothetical protein